MAAVEVPQTLEYRGGQFNAAPVLEVENFTNWKKRKLEGRWTRDEIKAANLDQRLKSLIMYVLPDDQMNSVINCLTDKSTWDDLILYHEGPSDVKESRVMDLKLCYNTFKFKEESQTDPSVAVTDSSTTNYDSADESLVCSTPLPPLKKLDGAEPISGPKTIKLILRSKSTFKVEALKSVIINEPSSAPAKGNKSFSDFKKFHSALPGSVLQKLDNLITKTCDHAEYISTMNMSQHLKSLGRMSLRPNIARPSKRFFPPCIHCGEVKPFTAKKYDIRKPILVLDVDGSRHMTGVKSYLHKYMEQPGPKVVFRDDSTCTTEGYGSIKCNGIVFTKVILFRKSQAPETIMSFIKRVENQNDIKVKQLRTDNGTELRNNTLVNFCDEKGISQNVSSPYTPEQNGVAERKNRTLIEAARTMLSGSVFSKQYWTEVVATACYTQNRSILYPPDEYLHPYEPSQRYQTNNNDVSFIETYECPEPVVLETEVSSDQNDQPVQNDEILNDDHSEHSNHTNDKQITDSLPNTEDIQISEYLSSPNIEDTSAQNTTIPSPPLPVPSMEQECSQELRFKHSASALEMSFVDFLSEKEPKKVCKALKHPGWVDAMQDELNQFARNKVWTLVPAPYGKTIIG
ncbi:retrovirus-related pol polyprotein from transposon TNT 1-94 [Tanacetum coccineum]